MTDVFFFFFFAICIGYYFTWFFLQTGTAGVRLPETCRASASPDLNHFCQDKNYQLLGNSNSALIVDHSSQMLPGNELLIKAVWY